MSTVRTSYSTGLVRPGCHSKNITIYADLRFRRSGDSTSLATGAVAKEVAYRGSVEALRTGASADQARSTVFLDANRNSRHDAGETGIAGVMVSNGREVVTTRADGGYALPAYDDMNLFITNPAGYVTPVNDEMVPQFSYIHKIAGSPDLCFGGIAPTGPLPNSATCVRPQASYWPNGTILQPSS